MSVDKELDSHKLDLKISLDVPAKMTPISQSSKMRSKSMVPAKPKLLLKAHKSDIISVYSSASRGSSKEEKRRDPGSGKKFKVAGGNLRA